MLKTHYYAYFLLVAAFLTASCASLRKGVDHGRTMPITSEQLYYSVDTSRLSFHSFSSKLSCELISKEINQSLKGNLRIVHDSAIWISVTPGLGIEAARLLLTPDSIFLLNRLKSTYMKGKFSDIRQLLNVDVDFAVVEAILTNNVFNYPATAQSKNFEDYKLTIKSKEYQLERVNRSISTKFSIDPLYLLIESMVNFEQKKMYMQAQYTDFVSIESHLFPMVSKLTVGNAEKKFIINLTYSKIEINQQLEFPFRIPDTYKQAKF